MSKDYLAPQSAGNTTPLAESADVLDLHSGPVSEGITLPLPEDKMTAWVTRAVESSVETIRDRIAYELIGFRYGMRIGQVRGRVQAARRIAKVSP